jgi:hypothetical protein
VKAIVRGLQPGGQANGEIQRQIEDAFFIE